MGLAGRDRLIRGPTLVKPAPVKALIYGAASGLCSQYLLVRLFAHHLAFKTF